MNEEVRSAKARTLAAAASGIVLAAAMATSATAQTSPSDAPGAAEAAPSGALEGEDVVVTARRRVETVQGTPASVASISAESLEMRGVDSPSELSQVVPGLNMIASGVFSQPAIRGISSTSVNPGDEANVSIYVDGVYYSQMTSNFFNFNNISRVEVLQGPQGTLFGRNATGGAITVITRDPSYEATGNISVGAGNFGSTDISAYYSNGITDNLAFDIAIVRHDDEGYVDDLIRGGTVASSTFEAARAKLLFEPSPDLRFTLGADISRSDNTTTVSSQAYQGNTRALQLDPSPPVPDGPYQYLLTRPPENTVESEGVNLRAEWDLGFAEFLSISSYREDLSESVTDTDGSLLDIAGAIATIPSDTTTQEFQLSSPGEAGIQWVVGLFGLKNTTGYDPLVVFPSLASRRTFVDTEAYAVFGEVTYPFTERLSATVGLRYSHEEKTNYGQAGASPPVSFSDQWESWTPRVILQYEVQNELNVYLSYSEGFKSGQFNSTTLSGTPVEPETISAWELGLKMRLSPALRFNSAIYRYDYQDIQVSSRPAGSTLPEVNNAARAEITGAEMSIEWRPTDALTMTLGMSAIDAEYTSFPDAVVTIPSTAVNPTPATACVQGTGALIGGNRSLVCDVSGADMIRTPDWTINLGAIYRTPLAGGEFDAAGNIYWSDNFYFDALNRLEQPAYTLVNGSLGWTFPNGRTRVGLWGENLTDEVYALVLTSSANADWVNYARPRSYGVELSYRF
jgi:iron complex outermembrane receptor protein